ncbi:MAG: gamma-glutamyltransferase [Reyranella sp.]|uniref:gamma-glutamyltransferase n=1 Tax=Reyranella sp. TaxID=1929291 RepID=UPI001AD29405|nr:gamma-glutamyltransferase [Reyranella sp.]MBN9086932.1 gamma-glutamyltransferase [Reyranella sp.]
MKRLLALALLLPALAHAEPQQMVAAAHPLAVEVGLDALRRGGTAVDAAVAVQMMLGVVEPQASGVGGGGFLLYYDAETRGITVYDGRETAPAGATATMFLRDGRPLPYPEAQASGLSVGVPGAVALLEMTHKEHGKLPWADLFTTSIATARKGFPMPPRLALSFERSPAMRAMFSIGPDNTVANPALADTMQRIASEGSQVLQEGPIAEEMAAHVRGNVRPGTLAVSDLAAYKPIKREALCGPYRVWIVCGMPPPSSGGIAMLQMLGLLEPFDLRQDRPNNLRSLHLIAEAGRLAFADRARYVADPAFTAVPTKQLVSPGYIAERRKLISEDRSMGGHEPVDPGYVEHGTSHMTIVDRAGNAVAFTTTVEGPFGAHMMAGGFILNNELTDFSPVPERNGKPVANRVEPGKRPRSSMSPTFVLDQDRKLVLSVGSAGGQRIIGDTFQALIAMLDWNLGPQAALDLPRVANMNGPTELEDKGDLPAQADALRKLGHQVQVRRHEGGLTAIRRVTRPGGDGWEGGADPRRDGVAKGE